MAASTRLTGSRIVVAVAALLSLAATWWYFSRGQILAYGDAESHLNIAKWVVQGIQPGLGQLGGIWLPLHHLLMLPFIWNDWLWRTGLAGSIVSMAAYVLASYYIYRLAELIVVRGRSQAISVPAFVAAGFFMLSPGILYMQSTPMSELPLLAAFAGSVFYLSRWFMTQTTGDLIAAAALAAAGTLIRYDAWFVVVLQVACVIVVGLAKRWPRQRTEGTTILFGTLAGFGIVLWLGWSWIIFKTPLYFLASSYSAKSQQQGFAARGELPASGHLGTALHYYSAAVLDNALWPLIAIAGVGLVVVVIRLIQRRLGWPVVLMLALLASPFIFNVLSLYRGISILFLPEVVPASFQWHLFNARYGLMMLPFLAVLVAPAIMWLRRPYAAVVGAALLAGASFINFQSTPITLQDGLTGLSARRLQPANAYVAANYDGGKIVFDDYVRSANPIALGVPIGDIIYVGYADLYQQAVERPSQTVRWIIVRRSAEDSYWTAVKANPDFTRHFELVFEQGESAVYKLDR